MEEKKSIIHEVPKGMNSRNSFECLCAPQDKTLWLSIVVSLWQSEGNYGKQWDAWIDETLPYICQLSFALIMQSFVCS